MNRLHRCNLRGACAALAWVAAVAWAAGDGSASEVLLKDGRLLKGKVGEAYGLAEAVNASDPEGGHIKQIVFLDNEITRTFISKRMVQEVRPDGAGQREENFKVRQPTARPGPTVVSAGPPAKPPGNFDEFGRRTYTMLTGKGTLDVIQAVTEITPQWIRVEGLNCKWDMRIAASSIPRDTLQKILMRQIDPKRLDQRENLVRFYVQSEWYEEARKALEAIVADFPEKTDVKERLEPIIRGVREMGAKRLLSELKLRRDAGQHDLVQTLLKRFPTDDVPGETLQAVREMIQEYEARDAQRKEVLKEYAALLAQVKDTTARQLMAPVQQELAAEMTIDTLPRMAAFLQNLNDAQMVPEDKLALAISGWLLGADGSTTKLSTAMSALRLRELARKYLSETVKLHRSNLLRTLPSEESAWPAMVSNLLAQMKPPLELPEPVDEKMPGYYKLEVVALPKEPPVTYYLQLPPEYDPHRRYPMIVSLNGTGSTAELQVDWWAGAWSAKGRLGQATRQGYIVMAPDWTVEHQRQYEFSAREHAAVLSCVRDACRRFAVDTDRVFLSGHSMGGDAAWDIGFAHPDLWAGVIPIAAEALRYCTFYWENAQRLPYYVIEGELDGGKMTHNASVLDRCLHRGYNTTVVEYLGRGHEHFSDELLRLFDWMGRFHRDFFPREFNCVTMRPWDNFFWWAEVDGLPRTGIANPATWPPPRGTRPVRITGLIRANNSLDLHTGTSKVVVWLAPQMIDFANPVRIEVNGRQVNSQGPRIRPSLETLLEDVRTRGDRQHPFWAKLDVQTGRTAGE